MISPSSIVPLFQCLAHCLGLPDGLTLPPPALSINTTRFRAVVAKTIRLFDGVPSPEYDTAGLDIVHLIRDPRAIALSQEKTHTGLWVANDAPAETGRK